MGYQDCSRLLEIASDRDWSVQCPFRGFFFFFFGFGSFSAPLDGEIYVLGEFFVFYV